MVLNHMLKAVIKRKSRFAMLQRAGVNAAMLVRTGGLATETYGSEVMGVSTTMLHKQRSATAAATAAANGRPGKRRTLHLF